MIDKIVTKIYYQGFIETQKFIVFSVIAYGIIACFCERKRFWRVANAIAAACAVFVIAYITLFRRIPSEAGICLTPFVAFERAKADGVFYRMLLMNLFLFVPFGATLANALPKKFSVLKKLLLVTALGFLLSVGVEISQYCFGLGYAETDDVIFNTLGALVGSLTVAITKICEKIAEKIK